MELTREKFIHTWSSNLYQFELGCCLSYSVRTLNNVNFRMNLWKIVVKIVSILGKWCLPRKVKAKHHTSLNTSSLFFNLFSAVTLIFPLEYPFEYQNVCQQDSQSSSSSDIFYAAFKQRQSSMIFLLLSKKMFASKRKVCLRVIFSVITAQEEAP